MIKKKLGDKRVSDLVLHNVPPKKQKTGTALTNTAVASPSSSTYDLIVDKKGKTLVPDFVQPSWVAFKTIQYYSSANGVILTPIGGQILNIIGVNEIEIRIQTTHRSKRYPEGVPVYARCIPGDGKTCYPTKTDDVLANKMKRLHCNKYIRGFAVYTHHDRSKVPLDQEPIFSHGLHLYGFTVSDTLGPVHSAADLEVVWFSAATTGLKNDFPLKMYIRPFNASVYMNETERAKRQLRLKATAKRVKDAKDLKALEKNAKQIQEAKLSIENSAARAARHLAMTAEELSVEYVKEHEAFVQSQKDTFAETIKKEIVNAKQKTDSVQIEYAKSIASHEMFRWCIPELTKIIVSYSLPVSMDLVYTHEKDEPREHIDFCSPRLSILQNFGDLLGARLIAVRDVARGKFDHTTELTLQKPNGSCVYFTTQRERTSHTVAEVTGDKSCQERAANAKKRQELWSTHIGHTIIGFTIRRIQNCTCRYLDYAKGRNAYFPLETNKIVCTCCFGFRLKNIHVVDNDVGADNDVSNKMTNEDFQLLSVAYATRREAPLKTNMARCIRWTDELKTRVGQLYTPTKILVDGNLVDGVGKFNVVIKDPGYKAAQKKLRQRTENSAYRSSSKILGISKRLGSSRVSRLPKRMNDYVIAQQH